MLLNNKNIWTIDTCNNMDESPRHYAKGKKPICCIIPYIKILERQEYKVGECEWKIISGYQQLLLDCSQAVWGNLGQWRGAGRVMEVFCKLIVVMSIHSLYLPKLTKLQTHVQKWILLCVNINICKVKILGYISLNPTSWLLGKFK